jgi:hypothetical protein
MGDASETKKRGLDDDHPDTLMSDDDDFSLNSLFSTNRLTGDELIRYGPLVIARPLTQGKAITLLATQIFNPALVLVEQIEIGTINVAGKSGMSVINLTNPNCANLAQERDYRDCSPLFQVAGK